MVEQVDREQGRIVTAIVIRQLGVYAMANFLLVHGAWHGSWCWQPVVDRLEKRGHRVITPTLTGLGDRSHLLSATVNMDTHIDDVVNAARWAELDDFVLCGHSYGGAVITGVAERIQSRLRAIVYVDALLPVDGQTACDAAGVAPPDGDRWPPVPASRFAIGDPETERWVERMMTPHPVGTITQPLKLTGAVERIPYKAYVLAAKYRPSPFYRLYDRVKGAPGWYALVAESGHHVMLDMPDLVVDVLARAARGTDALDA